MPAFASALVATIAYAGCSGGSGSARQDAAVDTVAQRRAVSSMPGYGEFYRTMRLNAVDEISFCHPTTDPRGEPAVLGVVRDMNGRPTKITRFFFGNPDTRQEWTTMQIEYRWYASTGTTVERRTWHAPSGTPIEVRGGYGVELLYKNKLLTMRRLIDKEGRPIGDIRGVVRSLYRERQPGMIIQEWFYGNGKQFYGVGTDDPLHTFGPLPPDAYFRRFWTDKSGNAIREEAWGIGMQPIPYPGGELGRRYELNECGFPIRTYYIDAAGNPSTNADGIAFEALEYDDFGRVVKWQGFGPDGTPRARSVDGVAAEVHRYRPFDGVLLGTDRYDAAGDLIEAPVRPVSEAPDGGTAGSDGD